MLRNGVLGLSLLGLATLACGSGGTGQADAQPLGAACVTDTDCRLVDDYCTGCDCLALAATDPGRKCSGPGVQCLVAPCSNKAPACQANHCAAVTLTR